ncbi:MAG: phage late control D family protein [Pseudomonas sp.]|jgi:phage protein D|uniref:phage late control D family protein n=1 Tax=Pseudomonas sp. TaxID=306 RepID=UPI002382FD1F|nr:phage late control D family protein [Pseudomonas sp.]MDP9031564.1 phage late control D family protein [Pseudomonadota bacterium]MDE1910725.1 phage late control D family protein [Pseudomonas sp.]MDE2033071.1 phage late control D family protein [Pseudomonas sp.]MDE2189986.1 phage late control D family protein [Pseudomonas sp.]MDE2555383.1 phage late control D family protein [Pseudomonas sp.]
MIDAALSRVTGFLKDTVDRYKRDAAYPVPAFRVNVDGNDIAQLISPRLMSLELTDNRGIEADQLSITLSDHDGLLSIPPKGAVVRLWLGWSDTGLVDKGTYTVDEIEHSGAPDMLSIRARSADLRKALKTKRERSWSNTTLGDVLGDIAIGNGLTATIAGALDGLPILQLDQANESDANLISRLGEEFDAVASVKAGCLLCIPAGGGKTVSGLDLPHITLTRADGDQHRYLLADRDSYDGVRAYFYDVNSAKKQEAIAGGGENLKDLRHTYSDKQSALRAARAEFNRLRRGSATLSYTLAVGRPDLIPELTYTLQGVKAEIDEIIWYGGNVQHNLSPDNGYTMSLELESKLPEDTVDDLAVENKLDYTGIIAYYRDDKTGKEKTMTAGDQAKPRRLLWLYANKNTAKRAVDREWKRLQATKAEAGGPADGGAKV